MKPAADWQATEKVTPRYGYGYAATSLQLAAAVNTIANGGVYVAPRLVLSTIDADGQTHEAPFADARGRVAPDRGHDDIDDEGCRLLRHGEVRQGARDVGGRQDRHGAVKPTKDPTQTGAAPALMRRLRRHPSAPPARLPGRGRYEGVLLDLRRLLPGRRPAGHDPGLHRPPGPLQPRPLRWHRRGAALLDARRPSRCTSCGSALRRTTPAAKTAQDDVDVSHASRGGRAGGP